MNLLQTMQHFLGSREKSKRCVLLFIYFDFLTLQTRSEDISFTGEANNYDYMLQWIHDKCVPFVREITFENAEVSE